MGQEGIQSFGGEAFCLLGINIHRVVIGSIQGFRDDGLRDGVDCREKTNGGL